VRPRAARRCCIRVTLACLPASRTDAPPCARRSFGCLVHVDDRFVRANVDYAPLILERMCAPTHPCAALRCAVLLR
jgi:hypothetical protein